MPASRREFLYGLGAMGGSMLFAMERSEPELILHNGNFWTVNPRQSRAQAVAICGIAWALAQRREIPSD